MTAWTALEGAVDDVDGCGRALVIAEVGVNHNGDLGLARELVDAAVDTGADAVKFQTFEADRLAAAHTPKVEYQLRTTGAGESHVEMLRKLQLDRADHEAIATHARSAGLLLVSTPYDVGSAAFLVELGVDALKTASVDIVDLPLHRYLAASGLPVIVATGTATLGEVETALDAYEAPTQQVSLLHCVSAYPCPDESLNLRSIPTLRSAFGTRVGWSDHSLGTTSAVLARALGATVFERHLTLDRSLPGPDHAASSTPDEFADYVGAIRRAEIQLGSTRKRPQPEEREMAAVSRKSLVYARDLTRGAVLGDDDVTTRRPGTGIPPTAIDVVLGLRLTRSVREGGAVAWGDLEA